MSHQPLSSEDLIVLRPVRWRCSSAGRLEAGLSVKMTAGDHSEAAVSPRFEPLRVAEGAHLTEGRDAGGGAHAIFVVRMAVP